MLCLPKATISIALLTIAMATVSCRAKLETKTNGQAPSGGAGAENALVSIDSLTVLAAKPGEVVEVLGQNIRPGIKTIVGRGADQAIDVVLEAQSSTKAKFTMPSGAGIGLVDVIFRDDDNSDIRTLSLISDAAGDGLPITLAAPETVCNDISFRNGKGEVKQGLRDCAGAASPSLCTTDGETGCVTTADFKAAKMANFTTGDLRVGVQVGGLTGVLSGAPGACASDGATGCLANSSYPAADAAGLASKILSGQTVAAVSGNVTLPAIGNVLTGINYGVGGTGLAGTLTLPSAANVLTGSGTYGDPGAAVTPTLADRGTWDLTASFPGAGYYAGVSNAPTASLRSSAQIAGTAGSIGDCASANSQSCYTTGTYYASTLCASDGGTSCVVDNGTNYKAAAAGSLAAGNIKRGVQIGGVTGTFPSTTAPLPRYSDTGATTNTQADGGITTDFTNFITQLSSAVTFEFWDSTGVRRTGSGDADITAANVKNLVQFENLSVTGSYTGGGALNVWDVRAGVDRGDGQLGKLKVACRNSANTAVYDAGAPQNAVADFGTDFFTAVAHGYSDNDTIRFTAQTMPTGLTANTTYYVRNKTNDTFQVSTTSGGAAIDFTVTNGASIVVFKWGDGTRDIWDTIDDYNNNLGVMTSAANTPAAWSSQNFCGGVGTASGDEVWTDTTTDGACSDAGDECRFKDKITGIEWSETQSTSARWGTAMTTCANLSFGGAGAWRVPTQKELMAAYEHGIYSAQNAFWITKAQMDANYFWASSTQSNGTSNAWLVYLANGYTNNLVKTNPNQVVCVR